MVCFVEAGNTGLPDDVARLLKRSGDVLHDRPVYEGDEHIMLYYWEEDGWPSGWWLGEKLGGDQVFAFNESDCCDPPPEGWRCPWHLEVNTTFQVQSRPESEIVERPIDAYTSWLAILQFFSGIGSKRINGDRKKCQESLGQFLKFKEMMLSGPFECSELITHAGQFYEERELMDAHLPTHAPPELLAAARSVVHKDILRILVFEAICGNKHLSSDHSVVAKLLAHFRFEKEFCKGVQLLLSNLKVIEDKPAKRAKV